MAAAIQILKLVNIELLVTAGHSFDNFYSLDILFDSYQICKIINEAK